MGAYIGHDLGTHGTKCVLVDGAGRVLATARRTFPLHHPAPDRAEQHPEDWWAAVVLCTRDVLREAAMDPADVDAMGFAGQMLALVLVDEALRPVRPALSWLDARATEEARRLTRRLGGGWVVRRIAGATPSAKDILPKVQWVRTHEKDVWERTAYLTDATGYLVGRATGVIGLDPTGAAATGLIDGATRSWSRGLARWADFPIDRCAPIRECTAVVGGLLPEAAAELGLRAGTPVVAGMADIASSAVGAGAAAAERAHICLGTSSWFAVTQSRPRHAPRAGILATAGAAPGTWLMIGENETAGACAAWLAREVWPPSSPAETDVLSEVDALAATSPPGARGLLFAPWMFGERSPVPDAGVRASFVGLALQHTRADVVRSVFEGIALNLAWTRDEARRAGATWTSIRVTGGGARSATLVQALADALGEPMECVDAPQHAGAVGAALAAAAGVGRFDRVAESERWVRVRRTVEPDRANRALYDRLLATLREVEPALARASRRLEPLRQFAGERTDGGA